LREGFAVEDFLRPERIVIGVFSQRPIKAMKEIYAPFNAPIIVTDINSAETYQTRGKLVSCNENLIYQCYLSYM
jgi:UDP-glucose 6-dehydrogenase